MEKLKSNPLILILVITGLIHIIGFFAFPYAHLGENSIGSIANSFAGGIIPQNLTGFSAFLGADFFGGDAIILKVIFVFPVLIGIVIPLEIFLRKKKSAYPDIAAICILGIIAYIMIMTMGMKDYQQVGYETNIIAVLMIILCVCQTVVAIIAWLKERGNKNIAG